MEISDQALVDHYQALCNVDIAEFNSLYYSNPEYTARAEDWRQLLVEARARLITLGFDPDSEPTVIVGRMISLREAE